MTVEAIDKLQVENQELQEKAKELMIKNDEQQLQIEGYQQMLAEAVDKLEIENQELKNETEKLIIENANQQTKIKDLTGKWLSTLVYFKRYCSRSVLLKK